MQDRIEGVCCWMEKRRPLTWAYEDHGTLEWNKGMQRKPTLL